MFYVIRAFGKGLFIPVTDPYGHLIVHMSKPEAKKYIKKSSYPDAPSAIVKLENKDFITH